MSHHQATEMNPVHLVCDIDRSTGLLPVGIPPQTNSKDVMNPFYLEILQTDMSKNRK